MTTSASLPVIDISPFLSSDDSPSRSKVLASLRTALLDYGFFYLTGYSAEDAASISAVLSAARTFFESAPASEKALLKRQDVGVGLGDGARGYQVIGENVTGGKRDWHEALDWYAPIEVGDGVEAKDLVLGKDGVAELKSQQQQHHHHHHHHQQNGDSQDGSSQTQTDIIAQKNGTFNEQNDSISPKNGKSTTTATTITRSPPFTLLHGLNLWPSTPSDFRQTFQTHISLMSSLGTTLLQAMGQALSLSDPLVFASAAQNSFWVMRAIGYPPLDSTLAAEGGVSCGAHSDYGCLTLLAADDTPGALQVWDRASEKWRDVPPRKGALVVNVGDMVERWTAGWVRSTRHRVVHSAGNFRVSVPFFLEPGREVDVQPLEECVLRVEEQGRTPVLGKVGYWEHLVGKVGGNFYGE